MAKNSKNWDNNGRGIHQMNHPGRGVKATIHKADPYGGSLYFWVVSRGQNIVDSGRSNGLANARRAVESVVNV